MRKTRSDAVKDIHDSLLRKFIIPRDEAVQHLCNIVEKGLKHNAQINLIHHDRKGYTLYVDLKVTMGEENQYKLYAIKDPRGDNVKLDKWYYSLYKMAEDLYTLGFRHRGRGINGYFAINRKPEPYGSPTETRIVR
jgi:hypothetical protein